MKIIKFFIFFFIILFIIGAIIFYSLSKTYNIGKIIHEIELQNNITFELNDNPKWVFFPEIKADFSSKIKDNSKQFYSKNVNFTFNQPYQFVPINFIIDSSSFIIRNLEIRFLDILGNYAINKKFINMLNIEGKIGEGNFNSNGTIDLLDEQKFQLNGDIKNIDFNQLLQDLDFADWKRIKLQLSSNNFLISSKLGDTFSFFNNLQGTIPITGNMYFVTTEEERFGIAFLNLFVEQLLPDYKKLGKSLSQIVNNFSDAPAIIEGELNISNGKIHTTDLHVKNNNNRINLKGSYDIPSDFFDTQIFFFETEELIVEAVISGSLKNPSIQIINENNLIDDTQINNDLKKVFEDGINTLIDKLLNLNE